MASYAPDYSKKMKALKQRHAALEDRIFEATKSPPGHEAEIYLRQLKKQKLALKDQIEAMA